MEQYQDRIRYLAVVALVFLSFLTSYFFFKNGYYPTITSAQTDTLSGKEYAPVEGDDNPYAPYFVGFDELTNRGIPSDDIRYINDVLTNYTLYTVHAYKAKVSYVKESLEREYAKTVSSTYRFKFGINDSNIHDVTVVSNPSDNDIQIKIYKGDKKTFDRDFYKYLPSTQ